MKCAHEALEISRSQYFDLYETAPVGYITIGETGIIQEANLTAATLLGVARGDLMKQPLSRFILAEDQDIYYLHKKALFETGNPQTCEIRMAKKCGAWFWGHIDAAVNTDSNDGPVCRAVISDITALKQAEEARLQLEQGLRKVQKAESLARMAGAIAHRFNNLLAVVIGNLEMARGEILQGSKVRLFISEALNASQQAVGIASLMLTYLGQNIGKRQPINLIKLFDDILPLLTASLPKHVELKTELPSRAPVVLADELHIRLALINLIINAGESVTEQKGDVFVSIGTVPSEEIPSGQFFPHNWEQKKGGYACISVKDTGCGIESCNLDKLFDPFYSTKFTGRGLGLPVVLGVAKAHEGAVAVESSLGGGSRFHLFLPLFQAETVLPEKAKDPLLPPPAVTGCSTVLVVEDEPALRKMVETMLKAMGHEVVTAADGVIAVEVFNQHRDRICCVLLDLTMPRKGGWETLAELRAIRPGLPVILSSGYDQMQVMAEDHAEQPQVFLHKPYQLTELKAALEKAMKKK